MPRSPSQKLCFHTILIPSFLEVVLKGRLEGNCLELKLGIMLDPVVSTKVFHLLIAGMLIMLQCTLTIARSRDNKTLFVNCC